MSGLWTQEPLPIHNLKSDTFQRVAKSTWSPTDAEFKKETQPQLEHIFKDPDLTTHALLRKHYKYLLPWVSNQPKPCPDAKNIESEALSYKRMVEEFRQLSLSHFTELSWAIYHDVRRREQDALLESTTGQPQVETWTRNKQNESRMVLCRILNEHFYRLITAVVLEQARRLSEIRIRIYRSGILTKP